MWERRTLVVLGLALLHLVLAATVMLETADVAWAPSYFDGGADDDGGPLPLSERLPALVGAAGGLIPLVAALAVVAVRPPAGPLRVAPARVRFRAPPLA
jgi:hypothetical protein